MRTYIIAKSYSDARWWASNHSVENWRYLGGCPSALGVYPSPDTRLVAVEGYGLRPEAIDIYNYMISRGWSAEYDATPLYRQRVW